MYPAQDKFHKSLFASHSSRRMRLLICVGLSLLLLLEKQHIYRLNVILSTLVSPIRALVNEPVALIDRLSQAIETRETLAQDNLNLRAKVFLLTAERQRLAAIEKENKNLAALLHSSLKVKTKVLVASLLAVDSAPFVHELVIDQGSQSGVFLGQPVIDAYGVMGQVMQVMPHQARVLLINDPKHAIPVVASRNGTRAIAVGDSSTGALSLRSITQTEDIQVGDLLLTSGLGGRFPKGYPVGTVRAVHQTASPFLQIEVAPAAHLNQSRLVLLVWSAS